MSSSVVRATVDRAKFSGINTFVFADLPIANPFDDNPNSITCKRGLTLKLHPQTVIGATSGAA